MHSSLRISCTSGGTADCVDLSSWERRSAAATSEKATDRFKRLNESGVVVRDLLQSVRNVVRVVSSGKPDKQACKNVLYQRAHS